jgi:hypothetical protein
MDFTLTMTLGASLLAIWLDARLVSLRPKTPARGLLHAAISALAMFGAVGLLAYVYGIPELAFMAVVLGVFLPTLVYALLAGLWMLRTLADLRGLAGR